MPIRIVEYTDPLIPKVRDFNARLADGGLGSKFYESTVPHNFVKRPGRLMFEEHFLATDELGAVRGAYGLKQQAFWIGNRVQWIADFWLPISEGAINRKYAPLAMAMLADALKKQPFLYGLGMGGYDEALPRLLAAARWKMFSVPFFFHVVHPFSFLRNITHLRSSKIKAAFLDFLAFSGIGWSCIKSAQSLCRRGCKSDGDVRIEHVDEFLPWADNLWEACKGEYGLSAVRDGATLNILFPQNMAKIVRLKVLRRDKCIGWVVLTDSRLSGHRQFGEMRLGAIVDCMALPSDASAVCRAANKCLVARGVDLIVSNQCHSAWRNALTSAGFFRGPSNFIFAASPKLSDALAASNVSELNMHLNRGDGDGPDHL